MKESTIGARIREFRMKKGITQVELSKGICTPSMVSVRVVPRQPVQ